jgi:two-component system, sensor histidine kinase
MIEQLFEQLRSDLPPEELERRLIKLKKINSALMQRVEKSVDQQANAYSLFQTAITLEEQVRLRTEELNNALSRLERTNDELKEARDAAERANRFKTRFFTSVGHDLLQPLHAARLSVGAMAEPGGSAQQHRLASRVEHALTTIEELLRSILDISKLEAGVITPSVRPVPLDEMFASLVLDIEPIARAKGLSLTWRRSNIAVISDPLMLRRILQNLLANAVQYTQEGGIKLAARRRGADVRIEVWDTGPGIPTEERRLIFEEFQRGPATDRPAIGGFGLGLSIVQRMSEALGHSLGLCSRLGHGTRFSISAPFASTVGDHASPSAPALSARTYGMTNAKVAVIDNDTNVLDAMRSLLESWSCDVSVMRGLTEFGNGIKRGYRPDILLVDYHLDGGKCGLDAVERLRTAASDASAPAIVITADHSAAINDRVRAAGCEILLKPVKPAELRALMQHMLSRPRTASPE